jgi:hypothetical protein
MHNTLSFEMDFSPSSPCDVYRRRLDGRMNEWFATEEGAMGWGGFVDVFDVLLRELTKRRVGR